MRCVTMLALACACGGERESAAPARGAAVAAIPTTLLGCAPAIAAPQDPRPLRASGLPPPAPHVPREWTPYAAGVVHARLADARVTAAHVADAVRARLPAIDVCFDDARGAVRALIAIGEGHGSSRVGGLGDRTVEACIASALADLVLPADAVDAEIACELARGGDAPLRVSPDAGYALIEVTRDEVRHGATAHAITAPPPQPITATATVLIVADPDAPGPALAAALAWAPPARTTLVAVKAAGGAPVLLGAGAAHTDRGRGRVVELRTDGGALRACIEGAPLGEPAPLLDARAMDRVLGAVLDACLVDPCASAAVVGTSDALVAKDLVATTSAAGRAGLAAIVTGGAACAP